MIKFAVLVSAALLLTAPHLGMAQVSYSERQLRGNAQASADSEQFANGVAAESPDTQALVAALQLESASELESGKIYVLDKSTSQVDIYSSPSEEPGAGLFGFDSHTERNGDYLTNSAVSQYNCAVAGAPPPTVKLSHYLAAINNRRSPIVGWGNGTPLPTTPTFAKNVGYQSVVWATGGVVKNLAWSEAIHEGTCGVKYAYARRYKSFPALKVYSVIDDTGSMGPQLAAIKQSLPDFLLSNAEDSSAGDASYGLITFKDSPTLRLADTTNVNSVIAAVQGLQASGGGDCPEDGLGALNMALTQIESDDNHLGSVVLATDASPHEGEYSSLIARAEAKGVKVHVLLSGNCAAAASTPTAVSSQEVYKRIADETGGLYFYNTSGSVDEYAEIFDQILETTATGVTPLALNEVAKDITHEGASLKYFRVNVPAEYVGQNKRLRVSVTSGTGARNVFVKWNSVPTAEDFDGSSSFSSSLAKVVQIEAEQGDLYIGIQATGVISGANLIVVPLASPTASAAN